MLELLKWQGFERASLAVQKANYAVKMYTDLGFKTVEETDEEYIMVMCPFATSLGTVMTNQLK